MAVAAVALVLNKCMKNGETCYAFHIKFPYYSPTCPTTTVFCTTSNSENEGWLRRKQREMAFPIYEALLHLIFFSFLVIKIFDGIFHARFFLPSEKCLFSKLNAIQTLQLVLEPSPKMELWKMHYTYCYDPFRTAASQCAHNPTSSSSMATAEASVRICFLNMVTKNVITQKKKKSECFKNTIKVSFFSTLRAKRAMSTFWVEKS